MLRFSVVGIEDGINKLQRKTRIQVLERAMHHVMIQARNMSKNRYCPVKTGMLRDSIYIRKVGEAEYEMGFTVYYGVWHEYGSYNIDPEGRGTPEHPVLVKTGYSPFIRPALWWANKQFPKILKATLEKIN